MTDIPEPTPTQCSKLHRASQGLTLAISQAGRVGSALQDVDVCAKDVCYNLVAGVCVYGTILKLDFHSHSCFNASVTEVARKQVIQLYCRTGFNCVVKSLYFWVLKANSNCVVAYMYMRYV